MLTEADLRSGLATSILHRTLERLLELEWCRSSMKTTPSLRMIILEKEVFGDNDRLSALVASRLEADLLVWLTDVEGVYTGPRQTRFGVLVRV